MAAKRFLFVSLSVLALAAAWHLGALSATATTGEVAAAWGTINGGMGGRGMGLVVTTDGDLYGVDTYNFSFSVEYKGNIFTGATPVEKTSWTDVKRKFR